jgi:hypothetical protein
MSEPAGYARRCPVILLQTAIGALPNVSRSHAHDDNHLGRYDSFRFAQGNQYRPNQKVSSKPLS